MSTEMNTTEGTPGALTAKSKSAEPVHFLGTFTLKVGTTNVATMPRNFINAIKQGGDDHMLLVPHFDEEVVYWQLFTPTAYYKLIANTISNPALSEDQKEAASAWMSSSAIPFDIDSQGRFTLNKIFVAKNSDKLKQTPEIVLQGMNTNIRLWTKVDHDAETARVVKSELKNQMKDVMKGILSAYKL